MDVLCGKILSRRRFGWLVLAKVVKEGLTRCSLSDGLGKLRMRTKLAVKEGAICMNG